MITRISDVANEHRRKCEALAQELGDNHDKLKSLERENQRLRGELAVLGSCGFQSSDLGQSDIVL